MQRSKIGEKMSPGWHNFRVCSCCIRGKSLYFGRGKKPTRLFRPRNAKKTLRDHR